jgi:hypothetical protein
MNFTCTMTSRIAAASYGGADARLGNHRKRSRKAVAFLFRQKALSHVKIKSRLAERDALGNNLARKK